MFQRHSLKIVFIVLVFTLLVSVSIYFLRKPILSKTAHFLIYEDKLEKCDAAFALSGDFPTRLIEAGDLYSKGFVKSIVLPNEPLDAGFVEIERRKLNVMTPDAYAMEVLKSLGVNPKSVSKLDEVTDRTIEEARAIYNLAQKRGDIRCIIPVTSKFHGKRVKKIYDKVFKKSGIKIIVRYPEFDDYDPKDWWHKPRLVRNTVNEYLKLFTMSLY